MQVRNIFVISDLHLGGAEGFQMCGPAGRDRLARFIKRLAVLATQMRQTQETVELVINGDFIDFLAEERIPVDGDESAVRWEAFTENPDHAVTKLNRIIEHVAAGVFAALNEFVATGSRLLLLLGNHDIELSVQPVRRRLIDVISGGAPARIEFLFDGEAYVDGDLHIEHGNRYDGWNQVFHDDLRHYRSALTRKESYQNLFQPPPGSKLVAQVMNDLKKEAPWVDLLKPEREVTLPILVALRPDVIRELRSIVPLRYKAWERQPRAGQQINLRAISGEASPAIDIDDRGKVNWATSDDILLELWDDELANATPILNKQDATTSAHTPNPISTAFRKIIRSLTGATADAGAHALLQLLQRTHKLNDATFSLEQRDQPEWAFVQRLFSSGRKVVLFGHTHLARNITDDSGNRFINTGTWCPLVRLPNEFFTEGADASRLEHGLRNLDASKWKLELSTFARVRMLGEQVTNADLNLWDGESLDLPLTTFPDAPSLN